MLIQDEASALASAVQRFKSTGDSGGFSVSEDLHGREQEIVDLAKKQLSEDELNGVVLNAAAGAIRVEIE